VESRTDDTQGNALKKQCLIRVLRELVVCLSGLMCIPHVFRNQLVAAVLQSTGQTYSSCYICTHNATDRQTDSNLMLVVLLMHLGQTFQGLESRVLGQHWPPTYLAHAGTGFLRYHYHFHCRCTAVKQLTTLSLPQSQDQICISCSSFTEHITDTTESSCFQWLRSAGCFTGVQEPEVHNGAAEQGSDVHQLLKLYKEEREQLSKDVLYYKQSCKDLKRRLKAEVLLGACQVHLCFEARMSLHDTQLASHLQF
jgi:hypothetical protein